MPIAVDVLNVKGEKVDSVRLPDEVFAVQARPGTVHEVITGHLAGLRRGTHSTKTRGEVSGGGVKPWKQKHTGRARAGSIRSPLWRHGGVIFGPKPRSYAQAVPAGKRRLALKAVLSGLAAEGKIRVVDQFDVAEPKTKRAVELARDLKLGPKSMVVVETISPTLHRASRNLADLNLCRSQDLTAYGALLAEEILFTKPALDHVSRRLAGAAA